MVRPRLPFLHRRGRAKGAPEEAIQKLQTPWLDKRPSIHRLVTDALAERGSAKAELRVDLSGENIEEIRWAPGALDSLFGWPDESDLQTKARLLVAAVNKMLRLPTEENAAHLYRLLCESTTISIIDETLPRVVADIGDRREAFAALSRRLILESPEVEPVKAGVAFLGASGHPDDAALISTIGRYEEITLYSVVALANLLPDPEQAIWDLAKNVHGWGRIRAVERLTGTENSEIKAWMLRDGFRNAIMFEYLAYTCATAGELLQAISGADVDDELLVAAGEILGALIEGGPAEDIEGYADGAAACVAFLRCMAAKPARDARAIDASLRIKTLGEGERAERLRLLPGWSAQAFFDIRSLANSILQNAEVKAIAEEGLASTEEYAFNVAAHVAPNFGIDPWPLRLERQKARQSDQWYWLMQTEDPTRIEQILALARVQLKLVSVGSGPSMSLGLGPGFDDDQALDFLLQDLKRFPGKGWDLIKVGLHGRARRIRNMAINALRDWGREAWPSDAMAELGLAAEREPDDKIRQRLHDLMNGKLID